MKNEDAPPIEKGNVVEFKRPDPSPSLVCPCGTVIRTEETSAMCPNCGQIASFISGYDFMDEDT